MITRAVSSTRAATLRTYYEPNCNAMYMMYQRLRKSKKLRHKESACVVSGTKLIEECFERGEKSIRHLFLDTSSQEWKHSRWKKKAESAGINVTETLNIRGLDFATLTGISGQSNGVAAIVDSPTFLSFTDAATLVNQPNARVLVLDALQDPGNVGTLIRTAYLLNWDLVCLGTGTVDPLNDKVVRSSGGTVWDQKMYVGSINKFIREMVRLPNDAENKEEDEEEEEEEEDNDKIKINGAGSDTDNTRCVRSEKVHYFVADQKGQDMTSQHIHNIQEKERAVLVLGNEGNGPLTPIPKVVGKPTNVSIPIRESKVGSLGVASAGSILMHALIPNR